MSLPPTIRRAVERGDPESVESAWLEILAEEPVEVETLVSTARALAANGEAERSRFLLQIADEELAQREAHELRWELLRRSTTLFMDAEALHSGIEERLHALYPQHSAFDELVEYAGLHRAPEDLERLWEKAELLKNLLELDVDSVVLLSDRGAGRISAINPALKSFRVELDDGSTLTVGFRGAAGVLQPLPPEHIHRQRIQNPEELRRLVSEKPAELLRRVLTSFEKPIPAREIRLALDGIVEESAWNGWWSGVREHPQVLKEQSGRAAYRWVDSAEDAEEALWSRFAAASPLDQLDLVRQASDRSDTLRERMLEAIAAHAASVVDSDPGLAFELAVAVESNDLDESPVPDELLRDAEEPGSLLAGVSDRTRREEAYRRLSRIRPDSPEVLERRLTQEEDPRSVAVLADLLSEKEPARIESFIDELLASPRRHPAGFLWLVEQAQSDKELAARSPVRLLRNLLDSISWEEFKGARKRFEAQLDSGGLAARLIPLIDPEKAERVMQQLRRAPLEEYQRAPLVTALELRFPELGGDREQPIYALPESIAAKREELRQLHEEEIPANRTAIQEARELGDLRENFEYKAARQRHEYLSARLASLEAELARARPIDLESAKKPDQVRIGAIVELTSEDGSRRTLTLLGPWESDPEAGILSHESDAGERLLGTTVGESVELPDGVFQVASIQAWHPD